MSDDTFRRREAASVASHRLLFFILGAALLTAVILGVLESLWPAFAMKNLPVACAFRRVTDIPCPGCGLTRSWVALGRGALVESVALHRLGWAVMLYVALQVARHGLWLAAPARRPVIDSAGRWLDRSLIPLAAALFINWGWVLARIMRQ